MAKLHEARGSDDQAKSDSAQHSGLKWERVKELVKVGLAAPASEERADAAKQLGLLRCTDPSVVLSLKQQIVQDDDERVQYECAKSLMLLGCLENEIVQIAVDYLIVGNQEVRLDVIKCISNARNIQYASKKQTAFANLVKALAHFCQSPDPDDPVSYEAAVCFGKLCVKNPHAVDKMRRYLVECKDTHKKALTLRILIKQFNEGGWGLVEAVLEQLTSSTVCEHRIEAAQLLQHLGRRHVAATSESAELVYSILEQRLWDDSQELVRLECAKTMVLLEMYARASETAIRQLSDANETVRAHAVTSLGTLGVKTSKIVRHLLEMLDLDPSDMVRRQVIRAFGAMSLNDTRVVRALRERERTEGMLASEAKKVLHKLETAATTSVRPSAAA